MQYNILISITKQANLIKLITIIKYMILQNFIEIASLK